MADGQRGWVRTLNLVMALLLGDAARGLLVLLHSSALLLAFPLHGFPVLFGCLTSHARIVFGASILLSPGWYGTRDAEGEEQEESCDSFHGVSEGWIYFNIGGKGRRDAGATVLVRFGGFGG